MSFTDSIKICLQKYVDFNGRASRSEYWWFVLLTFVVRLIPVIGWFIWLALILPSLSVQVRRLHDMDRSAWWLLLLVPPITIIGGPILLIMSIFPGTPGYNRYGPDPLASQPGADGFGFTPGETGELVEIAQLGGVTLGDDVVVGACSTIDRGALADTVVHDGVKIDNQVQIGHNCEIGEHTLICGAVGLAGSTKIGRHCALAGGAGVAGDGPVEICDFVQVGVVTTITRSITEPGVYSGGVLHNTNRRWRRNALRFNQLDDLARRIARLERER